jgi:16S rRNA (guanine527-N7)-methyltransferase
MTSGAASFEGFALEEAITERAGAAGIVLAPAQARLLAGHARAVRRAAERLHLTTVLDPGEFLERHVGESLEGAAMIDPAAAGVLLDLGSGNGYPGLVLSAARPGLSAVLAEASARRAEFLREAIRETGFATARVLERQVQRAADLPELAGGIRVVVTRAAGGWERVIPRLAPSLAPDGEVLVWAGEDLETVRGRVVWRRLELVERRLLPGRERSWVWRFRATGLGNPRPAS